MAYRDDLEAALARNAELERRVRELEEAAAGAAGDGGTSGPGNPAPAHGRDVTGSSEISALVAASERARETKASQERRRAAAARAAKIQKLARRPSRITVEHHPGTTRIVIARAALGGLILFQAAIYGVLAGCLASLLLTVLGAGVWGWIAAPCGVSIAALVARILRPGYYLELVEDGTFALHRGDPRRARLLGRTAELRVHAENATDPSVLHELVFVTNTRGFQMSSFTHGDLRALGDALVPAGVKLNW